MDSNVQEEEGCWCITKRSCPQPGPVANRVPVTKYTEGCWFVDCGAGGMGGGMGGGGVIKLNLTYNLVQDFQITMPYRIKLV
jgi:hypothetical protein